MKTRRVILAPAVAVAIAAGTAQVRTHAAAAAIRGATEREGFSRASELRVLLSVPASQTTAALDGRMLLLVSTDQRTELRFQVSDTDRTAQIFGVDERR